MMNVFCKYAKSTKRDTDDQTGGFGLGAKTPFAYTDAFTIITNVDGVKYTYTAYIDESRRGKISKLDEIATDEPNGTTIVITIKQEDRYKFETEIVRYTCFWDVMPHYVNFKNIREHHVTGVRTMLADPIKLGSGASVFVFNDGGGMFKHSHGVLLDGIPYDCDMSQISLVRTGGYTSGLDRIVISLRTGQVDVSVNRESLNYTTATVNTINEAVAETCEILAGMIQSYIDGSASPIEALVKYNAIYSGRDIVMNNGTRIPPVNGIIARWLKSYHAGALEGIKYGGMVLKSHVCNFRFLKFTVCYLSDRGNVAYHKIDFSASFFYHRDVYVLDTKTKNVMRSETAIKSSFGKVSKEFILVAPAGYVPDPADPSYTQQYHDDAVAAELVSLTLLGLEMPNYSSIAFERVKAERDSRAEIISIPVKVFSHSRYSSVKNMFLEHNQLVSRKVGLIKSVGTDALQNVAYLAVSNMRLMEETDILDPLVLKFVSEYMGLRVIAVHNRYVRHMRNCVSLSSVIASIDVELVKKLKIASSEICALDVVKQLGIKNIDVTDAAVMSDIAVLERRVQLYKKFSRAKEMMSSGVTACLADKLGVPSNYVSELSARVSEYAEGLTERYPMLKMYYNFKNISFAERDAINEYMRLIDADRHAKLSHKKQYNY